MAAAYFFRAIANPICTVAYREREWDYLIRLARNARLLAHLAASLRAGDAMPEVPDRAAIQLEAALTLCLQHNQVLRFELEQVLYALRGEGVPIVALKGAAYDIIGLPHARGRSAADVDILAPHKDIERVEEALRDNGWRSKKLSDYDERYYRDWSHEVPPLVHPERGVEVDLHHNILPPVCKLSPDATLLLGSTIESDRSGLLTLGRYDMLLHAAAHLFYNGEIVNSLRELVDIDVLLRQANRSEHDWNALLRRATQLKLTLPLYYAATFSNTILGTPIGEFDRDMQPGTISKTLMAIFVPAALAPSRLGSRTIEERAAAWHLFVRSHYIRMPFRILAPHLAYKSWLGISASLQKRLNPRKA